ncbi:MAG: DUF5318 family protein [Actinomycetota bacterium]
MTTRKVGGRARLGIVNNHPSVRDRKPSEGAWVPIGQGQPRLPVAGPGNGKRPGRLGVVDYTLAKRALLRDFRRGLVSRLDICDAHPELLRAARYVGENAERRCPVCERRDLRLLAYVYGDNLNRNNGRVWAIPTAMTLAARCRNGACYVVEVCTWCSWNHLAEAFVGRSAG